MAMDREAARSTMSTGKVCSTSSWRGPSPLRRLTSEEIDSLMRDVPTSPPHRQPRSRHFGRRRLIPKVVEWDDKQAFGWRLKLNAPSNHLTMEPDVRIKNIVITLKDLYEDVIKALDAFAADFDGPKKDTMLKPPGKLGFRGFLGEG
jgi:hypothetical protein